MRRQYTMVGVWAVFMAVLVLTACATDPARMVASTYAGIEIAADQTIGLHERRIITTETGRDIQNILERAYSLNETAEGQVLSGEPDQVRQALRTLELAESLLLEVERFLRESQDE